MAENKAYQYWLKSTEQVEAIIADRSLPLWQQAHLICGAYAGLPLDWLKSKHRKKIMNGFGKINAVFERYPLNSFDDYEQIEVDDLREIIRIVRSMASPAASSINVRK